RNDDSTRPPQRRCGRRPANGSEQHREGDSMPTVFVTKETGGMTRPMPMTVAAPSQVTRPEALERVAPGAGVNSRFLADLLSTFCAHERGGAHLYRCLVGKTKKQAWKRRYQEFGAETEEHIDIYEGLIRQLGGDPQYVNPQ